MTQIPVSVLATRTEMPAISKGLDELLLQALGDASSTGTVTLRTSEAADLAGLTAEPEGTLRVVSLLPFALGEEDYEALAPRLIEGFEQLAETGDPVFVLTVFRAVPERQSAQGQKLLRRIRKLNLLATELSREYGAFVVDLDRVFADVGGTVLGTDYRLTGEKAAQLAGQELALNIVTNGCDAFVAYDMQERARAQIEANMVNFHATSALSPADIIALGKGRSRQKVMMNTDAVQENHASWLVSQVLKGRISPNEALGRLIGAMRRRGPRESLGLLFSALKQVAVKKRPA